jgi:hypothetical protein
MFRGDLRDVSFPNLLVRLFAGKKTGLLSITRDRIRKEIFLRGGIPILARSNLKSEHLGGYLVARGVISREQEEAAKQVREKQQISLGDALVQEGIVGSEDLFTLERRKFLNIVYSLFHLKQGLYRFDEIALSQELKSYRVSLPSLLAFGIRRISDAEHLHDMVGNLSQVPVPTDKFPEHRKIMFTMKELSAIHQIDGARTMREIMETFPSDSTEVLKTMLILSCLNYIKFTIDFREEGMAETIDMGESAELSLGFQRVGDENLDEERAAVGNGFFIPGEEISASVDISLSGEVNGEAGESLGKDRGELLVPEEIPESILDSLDDRLVVETEEGLSLETMGESSVEASPVAKSFALDAELIAEAAREFGIGQEAEQPVQEHDVSDPPSRAPRKKPDWMDSLLGGVDVEFAENNDELEDVSDGANKDPDDSGAPAGEEKIGGTDTGTNAAVSVPGAEAADADKSPFLAEAERITGETAEALPTPVQEDKVPVSAAPNKSFFRWPIFLLLGLGAGLALLRLPDFSLKGGTTTPTGAPDRGSSEQHSAPGPAGAKPGDPPVIERRGESLPVPIRSLPGNSGQQGDLTVAGDAGSAPASADREPTVNNDQEVTAEPAGALTGSGPETGDDVVIGASSDEAPAAKETEDRVLSGEVLPEPRAVSEAGDSIAAKALDNEESAYVKILGIRNLTEGGHERVIIDLDGPVVFKKYALPEQNMVFISLRNALFDRRMNKAAIAVSNGTLKRIRMGQYRSDIARVVPDFSQMTEVKVYSETDPHRLVMLVGADSEIDQR